MQPHFMMELQMAKIDGMQEQKKLLLSLAF
jgi:hypothetical protein